MIKLKIIITLMMIYIFLSSKASATPITLQLVRADLNEAIMLIAEIGNINVSIDDSINSYSTSSVSYNSNTNSFTIKEASDKKETITMSFNNIEAVEALKLIAKTKDLNIIEENEIFIITKKYVTNAFLNTYVLPIRYGDAEQLRKAVVMILGSNEKSFGGASRDSLKDNDNDDTDSNKEKWRVNLFDRTIDYKEYRDSDPNNKRVIINKETNSLIIKCTVSEYEKVKTIFNKLDIPYKQVLIEAKILAINKSAAKDLGVEWKWSEVPQYPTHTIEYQEGHRIIHYDRSNKQTNDTGYGMITFGRNFEGYPFEWYYGAKINALITNGKAKILSHPNIRTIQGREAIIHIGSQVPIRRSIINTSTTTTDTSYRDAGIILRCVPTINADNSITTTVYTEVSTPQYSADVGAYTFNTRSAVTTVTLKNGEPMVIGGLIGKEEENAISKIPFLGDLPILGALFRNHHKSKSESELMIFLTAHVIEN